MSPPEAFLHAPRVAYYSMAIALESAIPTYADGLGVLVGDTGACRRSVAARPMDRTAGSG